MRTNICRLPPSPLPERQIRAAAMRRQWAEAVLLAPTINDTDLIRAFRPLLAKGEPLPWHPVRRIIWLVELRRGAHACHNRARMVQLNAAILREVERIKG